MHYAFPRSKCSSAFGGYIIQLNEFWILLVAVDELLQKFLLWIYHVCSHTKVTDANSPRLQACHDPMPWHQLFLQTHQQKKWPKCKIRWRTSSFIYQELHLPLQTL
ncbi:unnamed protein product [Musa hybrid cultivar]